MNAFAAILAERTRVQDTVEMGFFESPFVRV
jgi:hypothetical protein